MLSISDTPSGPTCSPPQRSRKSRPFIHQDQQSTKLPPHNLADLWWKTTPFNHRRHQPSLPHSARNSTGQMRKRSPQKPPLRANGPQAQVVRRDDDWTTRPELRIRILGLPSDITTYTLWTSFSRHGAVSQIEIFEDSRGLRDGSARITFR